MAQIALAWSFANDFVTAPIVGSTKIENIKELIGESRVTIPRSPSVGIAHLDGWLMCAWLWRDG